MTFSNKEGVLVKIKVVTVCSTETTTTLHPGTCLEMTVGNSPAHVTLIEVEPGYDGLQLVR